REQTARGGRLAPRGLPVPSGGSVFDIHREHGLQVDDGSREYPWWAYDAEMDGIFNEIAFLPRIRLRDPQRNEVIAGGEPHRDVRRDGECVALAKMGYRHVLREAGNAMKHRSLAILDGESAGQAGSRLLEPRAQEE